VFLKLPLPCVGLLAVCEKRKHHCCRQKLSPCRIKAGNEREHETAFKQSGTLQTKEVRRNCKPRACWVTAETGGVRCIYGFSRFLPLDWKCRTWNCKTWNCRTKKRYRVTIDYVTMQCTFLAKQRKNTRQSSKVNCILVHAE